MSQKPSSSVCNLNLPFAASLLISLILCCIYGARISNKIFDEDHTKLLLSLDLRSESLRSDPTVFVIINTHVDYGGAIFTWRSMYDKTLRALSDHYPGTLDSSAMDRYLGMGFGYKSSTGCYDSFNVPFGNQDPGHLPNWIPPCSAHSVLRGFV